jgi:DNA-binding GntR family transcriptional regulator
MKLKEVKASSLQDAVYDELFQAIISGQIKPGEKITIEQIAKHVNTSEMPVRGALAKLEARGIVSIPNKRRIVVSELSVEEVNQIYEIRLLLESYAVKKASILRSDEALERLKKLLDRMADAENEMEYLKFNKDFHQLIYGESKLPQLVDLIAQMWERTSPYLHILIDWEKDKLGEPFIKNHLGMFKGLENKDPKETNKWLKNDLKKSRERIVKNMSKKVPKK